MLRTCTSRKTDAAAPYYRIEVVRTNTRHLISSKRM
jgi:hypothetical protein